MTELIETVDLMNSSDYKERLIAEYWQLRIRRDKLVKHCNKIEAYDLLPLDKKVDCNWAPINNTPLYILKDQLSHMNALIHDLEIRALIEKIDLYNEQ